MTILNTNSYIYNMALDMRVELNGKTVDEVCQEVSEQGGRLGKTSLRDLLSGRREMACGFGVVEPSPDAVGQVDAPAVDEAEEQTVVSEPEVAEEQPAEQEEEVAQEVVEQPEAAPATNSFAGLVGQILNAGVIIINNDQAVLEKRVKPVKKTTKIAKLMELMDRPEGVSAAELMKEFNWTEGGVASYVHYEPQERGYKVRSEKINGERRYFLEYPEGVDCIVYK